MKKKGFTLVELLAVIAILAILVIIALPNVLELYKNARKNAFLDEVQSVYTSAINKYMLSQYGASSSGAGTYTNIDDNPSNQSTLNNNLDIQGGTGTYLYCITLDANGQATKFTASNGTFNYNNGSTTIKQAKDIVIGSVKDGDAGKKAATHSSGTCGIAS